MFFCFVFSSSRFELATHVEFVMRYIFETEIKNALIFQSIRSTHMTDSD